MTIASKPSTDPPDTVLSIQYLRGAAALGVVASHAAHGTFEIGASGVDVFFVISGFIMWGVTAKRRQTPGQFLKARAIRVAPPYLGLTLLVALGGRMNPTRRSCKGWPWWGDEVSGRDRQ